MNQPKNVFSKALRTLGLLALVLFANLASDLVAAGPKDFTLPSATGGAPFKLAEAKGRYVALHFLLKTECPVCLRHTAEYQRKSSSMPNVQQVFIKPDTEAEIKAWTANLDAEAIRALPLYRDADATLAKSFGIPGGYQFHGQVVHYPALVLLGRDGREVFRYVGKNNGDRFSFEKLRAKVEELK